MRPMSLYESGDSCGKVSLESLCHEERDAVMTGDVSLNKLTELIVRGGWPRNIGLSTEQAATLPSEYLSAVIDDDVYRIDGVKRNTSKFYAGSFHARLYHYQDYKNREIDAVIELEDGRWCAFEIKLGAN